MKRFILTVCAALLLAAAAASPSFAADIPRKAPVYKAPIFVAPFSWTGFYVGINGGYGWGNSNWTTVATGATTISFPARGALLGGTVGYNMQNGVWVFGLEGDLDASWIKGSEASTCAAPGCESRNRWLGTARGRVGFAVDRWLPFITGGAAFGDIKMTTPAGTSQTTSKTGWTAGGGVEYAFMGQWSAKLEYLYVDLGKGHCDAATCGTAFNSPLRTSIVRAGLNYRF